MCSISWPHIEDEVSIFKDSSIQAESTQTMEDNLPIVRLDD